MIEFENEENHYYGYRFPKHDVDCDWIKNGRSDMLTAAKLDLIPVFFSLGLEAGLVAEFTDRSKFDEHLELLSIDLGGKFVDIENSSFVLHYKRIYEDYDFSRCLPLNKADM